MIKKIKYAMCISLFMIATLSVNAAKEGLGVSTGTTEAFAKVGMSGGQFLKIAHGARGAGMAGAISAVTNDLSSVFYNPAGVAELPSLAVEFDYVNWFAGMNHNFAALGMPIGNNFAFALHYTGLSTDEMERTTIEHPDGTNSFFTANDISVGATIAGFLTDQFSFGLTVRYLDNSIAEANAAGLSVDVGTKYNTGVKGIVLGVSLHGLTTELTYAGNEFNKTMKIVNSSWGAPVDVALVPSPFDIPLLFRANAAIDVLDAFNVYTAATKDAKEHSLVAALDFITASDSPEQFAIGAEYVWKGLLALRMGYRMGHDTQGFSAGVGVNYQTSTFSGKIDYAISPMAYDLGLINRITIAVDLGK